LLVPGDDYAATTGTTVVLVQGASLNDKVEMIQYQAFGVADTVSRADGGAFGGNISTSGTLAVTGIATFTDDIIIGDGKTIGSASDVDAMTISSGGVVTFSQIPSGNFISHIDQWRLTTDFTGDVDPITSNLERVDTDGGALLGTAMTQSSGVFTFPVTGLWLIQFNAFQGSSANNNDGRLRCIIDTTTNGSDFSQASTATGNTHGTGGAAESSVYTQFIFDVTNVSTHKVAFAVNPLDNSNTTTKGNTASTLTSFTFIRLGAT